MDARRKRYQSRRQDLASALLLLTAVGTLWLCANPTLSRLLANMSDGINAAVSFKGELSSEVALGALLGAVKAGAILLAPLLSGLLVIAPVANYLQVGSLIAFQAVKPDINKLNPINGLKQKLFKSKPYLELFKVCDQDGRRGINHGVGTLALAARPY
ncbi:MAG: EscU/YscU/HrcU family type III secretion system export apparatus switch protein [Pyrinomonadaceae bacterium]